MFQRERGDNSKPIIIPSSIRPLAEIRRSVENIMKHRVHGLFLNPHDMTNAFIFSDSFSGTGIWQSTLYPVSRYEHF